MWLHRVVCLLPLLTLSCGEVIVGEGPPRQPPITPDERGCYLALDGQIRGVATERGELSGPCRCDGTPTTVSSAGQLADAMRGGGCVQLADGKYAAVDVPAGVQLVGASVAGVRIDGLNVGDEASVCRATVGVGVDVRGRGAELKYLTIEASVADGVVAHVGSSVRLIGSTVTGASRYGVSAFDAERVEVIDAHITDNGGPGVWMQCDDGCDCSHTSELLMRNTLVSDNALVGLSIVGTAALLSRTQVKGTTTGPNFQHGGGLAASGCSTVTADNFRVEENADFGVLTSNSASAMDCVYIAQNLRGVWLQSEGEDPRMDASIRRAMIEDNEGVGIGMCGWGMSPRGVITIEETTVANTHTIVLPVLVGGVSAGSEPVGTGIGWDGHVEAHMKEVAIVDSGTIDLLIDGPASGTLEDVTTSSGLIVQSNYTGGSQPTRSGSTPPIETHPPSDSPVVAQCITAPL